MEDLQVLHVAFFQLEGTQRSWHILLTNNSHYLLILCVFYKKENHYVDILCFYIKGDFPEALHIYISVIKTCLNLSQEVHPFPKSQSNFLFLPYNDFCIY